MLEITLAPSRSPIPGDDQKFYEVIDGRRVELPPMGAFETVFATTLAGFLTIFLRTNLLGRLALETLFLLDAGRDLQRRPDLAYVSFERWPRERRIPPGNAWDVVPDLAIEIVSPTNTAIDVLLKIRDYFRTGVRLAWVIYPQQNQLYIYESPAAIRVLQRRDTLDGGAVLPGFLLPLTELFEEDPEETA